MTEFVNPDASLPFIPDDLTIPQFILDSWHPSRPVKTELTPWFIEDATGRNIGYDEVSPLAAPSQRVYSADYVC